MDEIIASEIARNVARYGECADGDELARAGAEALEAAETAFRPERGRFRPFARRVVRKAVARRQTDAYEGLVKRVALNTAGSLDEDILQAGHEGIARARKTFDPGKGAFAAYACAWIRHFVQLAMSENRVIRGSARKAPTLPPVSLDAPRADGTSLHSVFPSPGAPALDLGEMTDAVDQLPGRERRVIIALFREGMPYSDLAAELGISEERVRLIRLSALANLRTAIGADQ